jgi:hypothetical protein
LLADSTPAALDGFRQALQLNPYHHGAHRHSLGLEFLLGRHSELENHARLFKVLYPEDPTPGFLSAMELAMQRRLPEARSVMSGLRDSQGEDSWERINSILERMAEVAVRFDAETILAGAGNSRTQRLDTVFEVAKLFQPGSAAGPVLPQGRIRMAQLPCIRQGMYAGYEAVGMLLIPYLGNPDLAIQKVKDSWRHHPEGWLPVLAGIILDARHPAQGPKSLPLLAAQADLFQIGADSPASLPGLPRLARFLATTAQFQLAGSGLTNSAAARAACLENLHRAATSEQTSADECRAYFDFAFELGALDSASALLDRWEQRQPGDPAATRNRIRLDIATGAYGRALRRMEAMPARDADEAWVEQQRKVALDKLGEVLRSTTTSGP